MSGSWVSRKMILSLNNGAEVQKFRDRDVHACVVIVPSSIMILGTRGPANLPLVPFYEKQISDERNLRRG